jgi:hypothetical protein
MNHSRSLSADFLLRGASPEFPMKFAMTRKYPPPKYHVFSGGYEANLGVDMEELALSRSEFCR